MQTQTAHSQPCSQIKSAQSGVHFNLASNYLNIYTLVWYLNYTVKCNYISTVDLLTHLHICTDVYVPADEHTVCALLYLRCDAPQSLSFP